MFKVLKDWKGSPDGFTVIEYKSGQIVDLHPSLIDVALGEKWVERFSDNKTATIQPDAPRRRKQNKG